MASCGRRPRLGLVSRRGVPASARIRGKSCHKIAMGSRPSRSWPSSPSFGDPSGTPDARAQPLRVKRIERALQSSAEVWRDRDVNHGGVHARVPEQEVRGEQVPSCGHRHGLSENVEQNSDRVIRCGGASAAGAIFAQRAAVSRRAANAAMEWLATSGPVRPVSRKYGCAVRPRYNSGADGCGRA